MAPGFQPRISVLAPALLATTGTPFDLGGTVMHRGDHQHLSGRAEGAPCSRLQGTDLKRVSGLMLNQVEHCPLRGEFIVHGLKVGRTAQPPPVIDRDRPESFLKDVPAAVQARDVLRGPLRTRVR